MARGVKLVKILGIQVYADYTWFIVFGLFGWSLSYGYFPGKVPGLSTPEYMLIGFASALMLFACVLIHELSHSYVANRVGLGVKEITLFIFGGAANLEKEPENAIVELKVALAGPLASGVLAVFFWASGRLIDGASEIVYAMVSYLALINTVLLVFNMIPGFPLDGGRVLRALLWLKSNDLKKSTRIATIAGKGFAALLIASGLIQILLGNFTGGLWAVLIGVFLQQAAGGSYRKLEMDSAIRGLKASDIMSAGVVTIGPGLTLREAVEEYFLKHHFVSFPVVSKGGEVLGLLTLNSVRSVGKEGWGEVRVKEAMIKLEEKDVLSPDDSAAKALERMSTSPMGRLLVMDNGRLVGVVSSRDLMKSIEISTELR